MMYSPEAPSATLKAIPRATQYCHALASVSAAFSGHPET
jgi:hypothetical protein